MQQWVILEIGYAITSMYFVDNQDLVISEKKISGILLTPANSLMW